PKGSDAPGAEERLPAGAVARLGTVRFRHGDKVTFAAFGPEGKTLITAGDDQTIRLWDVATGKELRRFDRSPKDKEKESDAQEEKQDAPEAGDAGKVFQVAVAADLKTVAATRDGIVMVWELSSGKELHRFQGSKAGFMTLGFSADGKSVLFTDPS